MNTHECVVIEKSAFRLTLYHNYKLNDIGFQLLLSVT